MSKPIQYFNKEYLEQCRRMTPTQIAQFLEDFRLAHGGQAGKSRLISLKVPQSLLESFKTKAQLNGIPYQTQIKKLMTAWLEA